MEVVLAVNTIYKKKGKKLLMVNILSVLTL